MDTPSPSSPPTGPSRYQLFVSVAIILAFITGAEIIAIWLPWVHWFLIAVLLVLSVVKFSYVIFIFMHLRWDRRLCTIIFLIGLFLAGGTGWALLKVFAAGDSVPLTSQPEPQGAVAPKTK